MIPRDAAREVAAALGRVPGVQRVLVAGRDGLPLHDSVPLEARERGAAATAGALGVAAVVAETFDLGAPQAAIVVGESAVVVVRPLACGLALAAVADVDIDVGDLHRRVRRHARELDEIDVTLGS